MTFRMVLDVGEWDNSRAVNSPGQSGGPRSPHYADLFDPWVDGESFPLAYSRDAVEAGAETRIWLRARPDNR
ncbi:penicillin acylase family protein [Microbacterium sp. CJ77]|uniref:penicillin acylase family protein n=1 Tax=Microbacterium sp. CJ77 TaxID=2079201 RepID=UPI001C667F7D|nr:penicillin acylase family protein [Microbacterium sp. CJ77]